MSCGEQTQGSATASADSSISAITGAYHMAISGTNSLCGLQGAGACPGGTCRFKLGAAHLMSFEQDGGLFTATVSVRGTCECKPD
jgi:hypothetical protein